MLFYQQKRHDKYFNFNRILAFSFGIHFLLILLTFFISTIKKDGNSILINLSNKSFRAASVSFKKKASNGISGFNSKSGTKKLSSRILKKEKNKILLSKNNILKKEIIKEPVKSLIKNVPKTSEVNLVSLKNLGLGKKKKKAEKIKNKRNILKELTVKEIINSTKESEKSSETLLAQVKPDVVHENNLESKQEIKQEVKQEINVEIPEFTKFSPNTGEISDNNIILDLDQIGDLDILERAVHDAITTNYYLPPGFESDVRYTISFEIGFNGEIKNINSRKDEPLALYTAIKQAILKAEFPRQKWGSKIELVY